MELLRAWRTHLLGGTAIALLVPGVILVAALAVGAAGGGLRGVGALGQALTGPAMPGVEPARAVGADPRRLLERSLAPPRRRPARSASVRAGGPAPVTGSEPRRRTVARPPDRSPAADVPDSRAPDPAPPEEPPRQEPDPSLIRQVGDDLTEVTGQVPVAGEPAGRVVDTLVETVEALPLPLAPRQSPAG